MYDVENVHILADWLIGYSIAQHLLIYRRLGPFSA